MSAIASGTPGRGHVAGRGHVIGSRAVLLAGWLALVGCSVAVQPTPTPAGMGGVIGALVLRGVTITQVVAGDPGCPGSPLHSNAARIDVQPAGDAVSRSVYLFRWRRTADFDAAAPAFEECVQAFAGRNSGAGVEVVDVVELSPWRAFGAGWTREFTSTVREALQAAAAGG